MLRNTEYGKPKECELSDCDRTRGAPLRSLSSYGCVLCTFHAGQYQQGNITLPDSATDERREQATDKLLA